MPKRIYIEADILTVDGKEIKVWVNDPFKGADTKNHFIAMRTNILRAGVPAIGGELFPLVKEIQIIPPSQIKWIVVWPCEVYEVDK